MRTAADPGAQRRGLLLALVVAAGVLNLVDRQIFAVLKPVIAADMGWSDDDYGTMAACFQAGAAGGFLVTGWFVDRLGVRLANPVAVTAWSVAALLHVWARSFGQFVFVRIALGATEAMGLPTGIKTIATILPPRWRSAGFGLVNAISSVGGILAPLAIPVVGAAFGWRGTFGVAGAIGLTWAVAWLAATRGVRLDRPHGAAEDAKAVGTDGPMLRDRRTWAIAGAKLLSDATWWLWLFWLPDFFHRGFGISGTAIGVPLAIAYAGAAVGSLVGGAVPTRLLGAGWPLGRVRKGAMLVSALCVVPVPLAALTDNYAAAVALMALALAGHQGFSTNMFALIADVVPARKVGRVTGFGTFCGNLGGAVIAKIAGVLLAGGHGYLPLLIYAAISYGAALGWLRWLVPTMQAERERS